MPLVLQIAGQPTVGDPWVTPEALSDCAGCDDVDLESVIAAASELLHIASGRRYGTRRVKVRPHQVVGARMYYGLVGSWLANAAMAPPWLDLRGGGEYAAGYRLNGPVVTVHEVKLDGNVLVPDVDYVVYDGRDLVRMATSDGTAQAWYCDQRLDLPDTEPGTWSVDYTWGKAVPHAGALACEALACSLARLVKQGKCGTPDRAVRIDRQGVTTNLLDPKEFASGKRMVFGVRLADLWVSAVNPSGGRRRSRFIGPDNPIGAVQ